MVSKLGALIPNSNKEAASGFKIDDMVKISTGREQAKLDKITDEIDSKTSTIAALNQFNALIKNYKEAANKLRNSISPLERENNAFKSKSFDLTSTSNNAGSASVTVSNEAAVGNHQLKINNLAVRQIDEVAATFTSKTDSIVGAAATYSPYTAGNITFTIDGNDYVVELSEGDNLVNIASKINLVTEGRINANIVDTNNGEFRLMLSSKTEGTDNAFTITENVTEFNDFSTTTQPADNAEIIFNNLTVASQTNKITNIVEGLTINLQSAAADGDTGYHNIVISENKDDLANAIITFTEAHEKIREFYVEQRAQDENGKYKEEAVLAKNSNFRSITNKLINLVNFGALGVDGSSEINSLGAIGIKLGDTTNEKGEVVASNAMQLDPKKLLQAIENDYEGVKKFLGSNLTSRDPNFRLFKTSNNTSLSEFTIDVDLDAFHDENEDQRVTITDGEGNSFYADLIENNGIYKIQGVEGTAIDGLELILDVKDGVTTYQTDIKLTQGIADKVYNFTNIVSDQVEGTIKQEITNIQEENELNFRKKISAEEALAKAEILARRQWAQLEALFAEMSRSSEFLDVMQEASNNK